jgi:hypothetical protein
MSKKVWLVFHDVKDSSRKVIVATYTSHQAAYAHCVRDWKENRFNEYWNPLQVTWRF